MTAHARVAFPMYDLPYLQKASDRLWLGLRAALEERGVSGLPKWLDRSTGLDDLWKDPYLFLSQCCGADLLRDAGAHLAYVATPVYDVPGSDGGKYCSRIVVREDADIQDVADLRGSVAVLNDWGSHSGRNALQATVAPFNEDGRFFRRIAVSGSHAWSLELVRSGQADVAGIDSITFALIGRHAPEALEGVRVLCSSATVPAPPFVTSVKSDAQDIVRIRAAFERLCEDDELAGLREDLLFKSIAVLDVSDYQAISGMVRDAGALGYDLKRDAA